MRAEGVVEYNRQFDPQVVEMATALISRRQLQGLMGQSHEGERDVYKAVGYRTHLEFEHYKARYDRQDLAARIVDAPANATWRRAPQIRELRGEEASGEEIKEATPFETIWVQLADKLKLWSKFARADRLAGIGQYGVLFIGVAGGDDLSAPIEKGSINNIEDIVYLNTFHEGSVEIKKYVADVTDPRFGEPELYEIDLLGDLVGAATSLSGKTINKQLPVHWTRVIHIAEGKHSNEVLGTPRLQKVYNRLVDLEKVVSGGGEMYWQGARLGLHVDVSPEFGLGDLTGDMGSAFTALETELDKYFHGLRRFIRTKGATVNPLGVQVADPQGHVKVIVQILSGATGMPMRMLVGSERGELASAQDEANWNARITERQTSFAQPDMLEAFINRLQYFGVLPATPEGYNIVWPSLFELDAERQADIGWKKSRALKDYADSEDTEKFVDADEFRSWVDLPPMTEEQKARLGEGLGLDEVPIEEPEEEI
jgi:hypothetical protein